MPHAQKAQMEEAKVKLMIWGASGSGKSRFGLSAPSPLVVDLEGSTRLYANEFDFLVAEVDKNIEGAENCCKLVRSVCEELHKQVYPEVQTLVIDPVTDLLDTLESLSADMYEQSLGKKIQELNQLQKTKWYAYRRDRARTMLNMLKDAPVNLILVARSKTLWETRDGKLTPTGETFDGHQIMENLMDVVIHLEKNTQQEYAAHVKKSRLGNLPDILPVKDYSGIMQAIEQSSKQPKGRKKARTAG